MKCEHCNQPLTVSNFEMIEDDKKGKQTLVCTNQDCTIYCGRDTNHPRNVAKTVIVEL